jgi:hypothetical protein
MRVITSIIGGATLIAALSACTTVAAPPPQPVIATQSQRAPVDDRKWQPVEPCLIGTRNCLSADQPPPAACLASTARCATEGARVLEAMER